MPFRCHPRESGDLWHRKPRLGLFTQPDWWEVARPGVGTNRYSYAGNDPVNLSDPGGNALIYRSDGTVTHVRPGTPEHAAVDAFFDGDRSRFGNSDALHGYLRGGGSGGGSYVSSDGSTFYAGRRTAPAGTVRVAAPVVIGTGGAGSYSNPEVAQSLPFPSSRLGLAPVPWYRSPADRLTGPSSRGRMDFRVRVQAQGTWLSEDQSVAVVADRSITVAETVSALDAHAAKIADGTERAMMMPAIEDAKRAVISRGMNGGANRQTWSPSGSRAFGINGRTPTQARIDVEINGGWNWIN